MVPVKEDKEDKKQEVEHTETYPTQEKSELVTIRLHENCILGEKLNTHQTPFAILQGVA